MDVDMPRYLQQLWGRDTARRRGPKPALTLDEIGRQAVAVADRDGLDAVSMKAMATHLGLSTMSLYRYLESKEELLSLMLHIAYGRPDLPPAADWRAGAEQWASALAARLHEHPWIVQVPMAEPPLEPNPLAWTEAGLAVLCGTGLPVPDQLSALLVIDGFVRSHTALSLQIGAAGATRAPRVRPGTYGQRMAALVDPAVFPHLARAGAAPSEPDFHTGQYTFGLALILDGLAAHIALHGSA
ncbi:TetR/AcrR family transcriptional regulator C-terminal domain-containing protein [Dactylosporangium vinaceum]|uniref:TetR/AcrR family transcriptional regulator n=1 Tax=Dactylosporangium vinaceum TaxID=53362 RepID=A0ABV5MAK2_9ACTN|nr:TetR/AcrR family transcriptional regulator [Dactylosporangium vinaceum]UAB92951.1 TetR/AcrR family transcriptional regulator C-terminal domain-containing protein [Dactylosporangium vinaceum]